MLLEINPNEILFLDIETVAHQQNFEQLDTTWQYLWQKKAKIIGKKTNEEDPNDLYSKAGIYAEFGKVICISVGYCYQVNNVRKLRIKSFYQSDEKELLTAFSNLLNEHFGHSYKYLCAHNGIEFDYPFLCRRMLINGIKLPNGLKIAAKKQWENKHLIDTMELWKFGDYKAYTSLEVLAAAFNIETPKDDISGADIYKVYYEEQEIDRIVKYCQKDVIALCNLYLAMNQFPKIDNEHQEIAE